MAEFSITLLGKTFDQDQVREAFEIAVQAIRGALEEGLTGELTLDGVPYSVDDVPEGEAADVDESDVEEVPVTEEEVIEEVEEDEEIVVGTETETQA